MNNSEACKSDKRNSPSTEEIARKAVDLWADDDHLGNKPNDVIMDIIIDRVADALSQAKAEANSEIISILYELRADFQAQGHHAIDEELWRFDEAIRARVKENK